MTAKKTVSVFVRFVMFIALALTALKTTAADPPAPLVYLLAVDPDAAEAGADTALFLVIRTGPTNAPLTVQYEVAGAAQNGIDYQTLSGSVTIPAGEYIADIVLTPIDDSLVEGGETVLVGLEQPLVWPPPYIVAWPSIGVAAIEDNDRDATNHPPSVALVNPPDGSVFIAPADITLGARASDRDGRVHHVELFEGTNSLGIVTNRWRPIAREISLTVSAADANLDITPDEFPDFNLHPTPRDPVVLPGNLFRLLWEDVSPGHYVLTAVATDNDGAQTRSEPVEIRVSEQPPQPIVNVIAVDPVAAEGPSPGDRADVIDTATFVVRRSGNTNTPLTVYYRLSGTASNGADYERLPHSVTIPAGERGARVVVVPIDDHLVEGTESIVLTIVPPVCIAIFPPPPDCYIVGRHDAARAVIRDNDPQPTNRPPFVEIVRPLDGSVFLAPADIAIVAQARDADGEVVTVEFFEGTNSLGLVTNNPNTISSDRPPFMLVWSNVPPGHYVLSAEATDNDGATSHSRPVEIKVVERTIPPIVSIVATDAEASEGDGFHSTDNPPSAVNTATFRVSRTGPTTRALLVHYTLDGTALNGIDYRKLTGEVSIPMGAASANVVVHPIDDHFVEGPETVIAVLIPSLCAAVDSLLPDCYIIGTSNRARAIIRDNDTAPTNQPPRIAIVEPSSGDVFLAPADIKLVAEARDADGFIRAVEFFANGSSIGVVTNRLPFIANEPSVRDALFSLVWSDVLAGDYALTAKATDNRGAMTTSEPIRIQVVVPEPPVVTIVASDPYGFEGDIRVEPAAGGSIIPIPLNDTATFTVRRSRGTNHPLVVYYSLSGTASNGVDYRKLSGEVIIPRGAWRADIVVDPIDDALVENTETVVATLDPIACPRVIPPPPECYLVGDPNRAVAYIRDNDFNQSPKVEIVSPADGAVFSALADIEIEVLTRDPDGYVTKVEFFAGTNRIGVDERVFIIAPPPGQEQKFSMVWSNVPPGEYKLTAKATDDRGAMTISDGVKITVIDRPRLPIVTIEAVDKSATEQSPLILVVPDTALFLVSRTGETNRSLLVYYSIRGTALNGVDYQRLSGEVEIPAGASSARIHVIAIDDSLVEPTETVVLTLEPPICIATDPAPPGCYVVGNPGHDTAYIHDDDVAPNRPPAAALISPPDGSVFAAPADIWLIARASDSDGYVRTVEFFEGANSLGIVTNYPILVEPPHPVGGNTSADGDPAIIFAEDELEVLLRPIPLNPFRLLWQDVPPGRYLLTAVATDNLGASTRSEVVEIKVVERPQQPVVTVTARDPKASEGPLHVDSANAARDTALFSVKRTGPTSDALTVHYRLSGTASNGVDYDELRSTVTIPAGSSHAPVVVNPIDDHLVEGRESVIITIVEPICIAIFPPPPECYVVGRNHSARAVIYDNDSPPNRPPVVRIISPEDGQVFLAPADIQIDAKAADSDGFVRTVEFFEGTNSLGIVSNGLASTSREVQLFTLRWEDVPAGHYVLTAVATDNDGETAESEPIEIKVVERHEPPVVNIVARDPEAREINPLLDIPEDPAWFVVTRSGGETNRPLTVHYRVGGTASNGIDYVESPGTVTIPANALSADIFVEVIDDRLCEGDESVVISLVSGPCISVFPPARGCYLVGSNRAARAVIHDDESCPTNLPPKVAITSPHNGAVFNAPANIHIMAQTLDPDGWVPQVEFFEGNKSLGIVTMNFIVEPPPGQVQTFDLRWTDVMAGNYILTAVATDNNGKTARSEPVRISVVTPPTMPTVTIVARDPYAREGNPTNTAAFSIRRDCCTNSALTVWYSIGGTASNGVDYPSLGNSVTIPAGQRSTSIVIAPVDDRRPEPIETIVLQLQQPPTGSPVLTYHIGKPDAAAAIIVDNDHPTPVSQRLVDGLVHLRMSAADGFCYRVEASTDLVNWEVVCRNTARGNALHFVEPHGRELPRRFYRVVPDVCDDAE